MEMIVVFLFARYVSLINCMHISSLKLCFKLVYALHCEPNERMTFEVITQSSCNNYILFH